MSGDELTIRATFLALAVAFGLGGMTVAGWNSRILISGLFAIAIGMLVLAVFWPWISNRAPQFRGIMESLVINDYAFAMVSLIIVGLFVFDYGVRSEWFSNTKQISFRWDDSKKPLVIAGKRFLNDNVILDGFDYRDCVFEHVTFVFNGTTSISMTGNKIVGGFKIKTENPSVDATVMLLRGLGMLSDKLDMMTPGPGFRVNPPISLPPQPPKASQ
jgi:hypothetical protein